jgi:U3 small nucleolar RNA-associated protein 24
LSPVRLSRSNAHAPTAHSKANAVQQAAKKAELEKKETKRVTTAASSLFFAHNEALGPPYRVLVDTNFINFSLQNKIELVQGMMDCLYAECEL